MKCVPGEAVRSVRGLDGWRVEALPIQLAKRLVAVLCKPNTCSARMGGAKMKGRVPESLIRKAFLATIGAGRKILGFEKGETIFAQGGPADAVFYVQKGKIKLTVVSQSGKEATVGILGEGSFFGEGALAGQGIRMGSASAMTDCAILRIDKKSMIQALHREQSFSDLFVSHLLARNIRYEEDLVDQLFNSSEKRLGQDTSVAGAFRQRGQA